jgi:hypothetical protein
MMRDEADKLRMMFLLGIYAALLLLTRTLDQGDTELYVGHIIKHLHGIPDVFWEFGHPLWRPLGYAIVGALDFASTTPPEPLLRERVVYVLTSMAVTGGVVAALAFYSWLRELEIPLGVSFGTTLGFMLTSAFLGFEQTGSSYIPSLAFLLIGLRAIANERASLRRTLVVASLAFAAAVLFWFPMVLAVPAAAASALVLRGDALQRRQIAIGASLGSGVVTIFSYAIVAYLAGIRSVVQLREWIVASGHGISGIGGLPRAVAGFGRSLVDTGRLGLLMKRHMLHDPYNPSTWADIIRAGLFRLVILYVAIFALTILLLRRRTERRALLFLLLTAIPVGAFAYEWQGGDPERYLAMYPALFSALAISLVPLSHRVRTIVATAVVASLAMINVPSMSRTQSERDCARLTTSLMAIPHARRLTPVVVTPHELDEILSVRSRCPNSRLVESGSAPQIHGLVMAHSASAPLWRASLAARAERTWKAGNHIWVALRAFAPAPSRDWDWAEGDDPRIHWRDFPSFFGQLDVGPTVGGADGFVELLPTARNRQLLSARSTQKSSNR